jgi:C4-dicarboxylate-specific signal transduction histidine kinase
MICVIVLPLYCIFNALKTAIVSSVLLIIFHRKIAAPILELSNYFVAHKDLSKITADDIYFKDRVYNDEISVVTEQILIREAKLAEWAKSQQERIDRAESKLAEADEQIRQEKIRAESSARLAQLGEMATSIAHEINNPLAIISGYNFLILKEASKENVDLPKIRQTVQAVESTIIRITKIISGLRSYARDGSQEPMAVTPVQQIIDDTMSMCETKMRTKGVSLRVSMDKDSNLAIKCRAVQMVQVLVAIINNSIDAVEKTKDSWIEIGASKVGEKVRIAVTDSGNGISPDIAEKIFQPFFTTKEVGVGTGLGLSIAFAIIKDHQGFIYVDSSQKNTCFVIELKASALHSPHHHAA